MSVRPVGRLALVFAALAWLGIIGPVVAQEKVPVPEAEEAETLATGAKELNAFATVAVRSGFPGRARLVWLEVIGEYAPDDEVARKALGFLKQGPIWKRDPAFEAADKDALDPAGAKALEQKFQAVAARLGPLHRALAEKLAAANKKERADYHFQRALRFQPTDQKAIEQSGRKQFEGITGDDVDIAVLQRSRLLDRAVQRLVDKDFAATVVADKLALLDAIGAKYQGVKSEHFKVFGDHEVEALQKSAVWAERALAFCQEAFAGFEGFPPAGKRLDTLVFLKSRETWNQLVKKHVNPRDAEFIVANASGTKIGDVETATDDQQALINDHSIRWVVQDYAGLRADALQEGIGHAVVGMFLGRNLVFTVGRQDDKGTVAGKKERKLMLPDLDAWKDLAVEMAWQRDGVPASRLPLLKAAEFPSDARIKAWSFCDYLLRRDPVLLLRLQATSLRSRNDVDVLADFQKTTQQSLQQLEERWRRFWTEDTPLRRAVVMKVTPLESASREAPAWLAELNRLRKECGRKELGWAADASVACREHAEYLKANKDQRGADKEHIQVAGKPGFTVSGRGFAPLAIVWTRDVKKAGELWLSLPGYRDVIVNTNIETVGLYADGGVAVFDGDRGGSGGTSVTANVWPEAKGDGRAKDPVPAAVDVDLLGPEVQQLLAANNRAKQKQVGYPLSLHGYLATLQDVQCKVTCGNEEVAGFLVQGKGQIRRTSAPGMWVFYPAEPLKRGADIRAVWTWKGGNHTVTFVAK